MRFRAFAVTFVACVLAAGAQAQTPLRVIAFDGGWNLPVWAAQRQGFFEANGVSVQLSYTPTSVYLITKLLDGTFDIALALMDNFVAIRRDRAKRKF
jgi:ABC-type nitrate/sulfonate/bicarbonate transport system substrate-binding protein